MRRGSTRTRRHMEWSKKMEMEARCHRHRPPTRQTRRTRMGSRRERRSRCQRKSWRRQHKVWSERCKTQSKETMRQTRREDLHLKSCCFSTTCAKSWEGLLSSTSSWRMAGALSLVSGLMSSLMALTQTSLLFRKCLDVLTALRFSQSTCLPRRDSVEWSRFTLTTEQTCLKSPVLLRQSWINGVEWSLVSVLPMWTAPMSMRMTFQEETSTESSRPNLRECRQRSPQTNQIKTLIQLRGQERSRSNWVSLLNNSKSSEDAPEL